MATNESGPERVAVIGAGAVGTAIAAALSRGSRFRVTSVHSRTREKAERAARLAGGAATVAESAAAAARDADVVLVTTPDDAISRVAEALAAASAFRRGALVAHCSGALAASDALRAAKERGARIGSIHPLQSFAGAEPASARLDGVLIACEGDDDAAADLEAIARDLGGTPFRVKQEDKPLYHAAAALASNSLVALVSLSVSLLASLGLERGRALASLLPLVRGTVENLGALGLPRALTGPIARGDVDTARKHAGALSSRAPAALPAYLALAEETIAVAREKGTLSAEAERGIRGLLARLSSAAAR